MRLPSGWGRSLRGRTLSEQAEADRFSMAEPGADDAAQPGGEHQDQQVDADEARIEQAGRAAPDPVGGEEINAGAHFADHQASQRNQRLAERGAIAYG